MLSAVISSSVRSGSTSLTEPTIVVLPTPKPPAMRILTAIGMACAAVPAARVPSECA